MTNSFNIYNASAGSGKTFTLVKEYLVLLFNSRKKDSYKNILAITFTNKAVGEMKKRIIESLTDFTIAHEESAKNPLLQEVSRETGLSEEEIRSRSAQILKSIIHNYAAFEISTIDGFTHRILRTFARDLGIPMNFEVELDTEDILMEAVESLISRAGSDRKLTEVLIEFTLTKTDDDKSWDISRDLFEISKLLINENHQKYIQLLKPKTLEDFENFDSKLVSDIEIAERSLKAYSEHFFDLINSNQVEESWFTRKSVPGYFNKLLKGDKNVNFETNWARNIADAPLYNKSLEQSRKDLMDGLQPEIADIFQTTKDAFFKIEYFTEIRKNLVQLSLLNEINREVEKIKKERNVLLISEFNPKISEQVKDQPAPFIYERLGERYQNYFIDEFQDTSIMQWENLIPLIDHNLSQTQTSSGLTIVGDAKQSIYRWRGGRAEQLIDLYNQNKNPFQIEPNLINLPDNYRSGSSIVNFNNSFFQFAASSLSYPDYAELFRQSAQNPKKGNFGYVNISFLEVEKREEEFEKYPARILDIISEIEKNGYTRKDICILTRRKKEGIAVAEYLSENSIPVISSETLLISQSTEVQLIIDILNFSINPEDGLLKFSIFDKIGPGIVPEQDQFRILHENLKFHGAEFFNWLADYDIDFELSRLKKLSLYEASEYIIRSFDLVSGSNAYVQYFLDFVFENSQKTTNSLHGFLEKWEKQQNKLSIVVPESGDAVNIMTIHKSKGLEFPVVIYPFANSELQDTRTDNVWLPTFDENIPVAYLSASKKLLNWNENSTNAYNELIAHKELDTLNVLYVACTRAAQQLYILSNYHEKPKSNPNVPDLLMDYLKSQGKWSEDMVCEFGDKAMTFPSKNEESKAFAPSRFYSSPVQNQAVSIITRSGSLWDSKQQEAIEKGEIAHEILARVNKAPDLPHALSWAIDSGLITEASRLEIENLLRKILDHPDLKEYYSEGVRNYNERELLTSEGERLRPDRLNFKGNTVTIIDYKTGGFVDKHEKQISNYAKAIKNMGFEVDKCLLVYTNEPVLIKVV
ncbi:UvrD-helicase domain-containing protein [Gramella sp. GC03-9]|uniref:DNA 3'-5' helicase n=1 Tax=Christiangramia oceanisediminis TaxID=2920386 RepID=A0A9X2I8M7_9FLAO|nr:UvrD-helicase domain-containing protein [Gramella oceanisediminis]MCP9199207.1 UvrD-helicase domain-containing protein [Gramella oceanisediminis]